MGRGSGSAVARESRTLRPRRILARVRFALIVGLILLLAALQTVPLTWMVSTSLKTDRQLYVFPPVLLPSPAAWSNYLEALAQFPFPRYVLNTLIVCLGTLIGALVSNTLVGYGFARLRWVGRDAVFIAVVATLMVPFQVTMIPMFVLYSRLGMTNTFLPLILPAFFGNPFFIFLLRQFMKGIPIDLSDAALIDGASELGVMLRIVLPLCKPALATVALFQFIGAWSDFLGPLIYLSRQELYTISLGLASLAATGGYGLVRMSLLMAASVMAILPILLLFIASQKVFIQGVTLTGLKG